MMHLLLSVLVALVAISIIPTVFSESLREEFAIPDWVKNTAGWWADGQIPDSAFLQGIQFLIKEEIITVQIPTVDSEAVEEVPGWVKNTVAWWAEGKIHDITFAGAIKYLLSQGIITVEQEQVEELVEETVEISDFYMEVNGDNCCQNWAYVGKDYLFQIETLDKHRGSPIDGVAITAKIISKDGELRYDFGQIATENGIYKNNITIPSMDWYAGNILSVTGEYYGVEKTIEKEFEVFRSQSSYFSHGCGTNNPFDVSGKDATMSGITFNSDGSKMFLVGLDNDNVYEYKLCKNYTLGSASYTTSFSLGNKITSPQSIAFNSDGTKMFVLDQGSDDITEYALSTAFDVSSAVYTAEGCDDDSTGIKASGNLPTAIDFNSDGTKLRVLVKSDNIVAEFTLSTGFDMTSTCSEYASGNDLDISGIDKKAEGMAFNSDGTKIFILGNQYDKVYEYTLDPAYDVSAETLVATLSISTQDGFPRGLEFSSDGKKMFIVGTGNGNVEINEYDLATGWNISTAEYKGRLA